MSAHNFLEKRRYYYGIELRECSCGVWRYYDEHFKDEIPCFQTGERKQLTAEAFAQLNQAFRNLGYELHLVLPKWLRERIR
ncbi:hypothetical protein [Dietzia natronolimnaea]|uniref:hypothetical protein n=1 Tax=Dietzia natronolimnaea TaxID=161920 RepID=UPI0015FC6C6B|nr:hypothetical protein [Dietzia natronolimnaea]MBB1037376.1 hypothetical protein [Dietzia natronolimnaea]